MYFKPLLFRPWFAKVEQSTPTRLQLTLMVHFKQFRVSRSMKHTDSNWTNDSQQLHIMKRLSSSTSESTRLMRKHQIKFLQGTMNYSICNFVIPRGKLKWCLLGWGHDNHAVITWMSANLVLQIRGIWAGPSRPRSGHLISSASWLTTSKLSALHSEPR